MTTIIGSFDNLTTAQNVVDALVQKGFKRYEISLMANASSSDYANYFADDATPLPGQTVVADTDRPLTTGEGTSVGAVAGIITGLVAGLAVFVIPGVGPIIAAGPLLAGLTGGAVGAVAGAATGGIVAALVKSGVPEEEASLYAESVKRGGTLVLVRTTDEAAATARSVMRNHNAIDVVQHRTEWQAGDAMATNGVLPTDRAASARAGVNYPAGNTFEAFEPACHQHFDTHYANRTGITYAGMVPFYRYGYNLATDPRYASATWDEVEADAHTAWDQRNPNDAWDNYRDAVHFGWDCGRRNVTLPSRQPETTPVSSTQLAGSH
jgi:hypothetical protein